MKGEMLCVIDCLLSSLTVILLDTTVLWLQPGQGMAQINAGLGGGGDLWCYKGSPGLNHRCLVPSQPPARCGAEEDLLQRVHLDPRPSTPQMFIDL